MSYRHDVVIYDPEDDIWSPIVYAPGYYVSENGHVWGPGSLGRLPHELSAFSSDAYGHQVVDIVINGKRAHKYVHRLVAEAFIPNPMNYPEVRHMDGDPYNNAATNLEWGTHADNMKDAQRHGTFHYFTDEEHQMSLDVLKTPVKAINIKTSEEFIFESQAEAARILNVYQPNIRHVLSGVYRQTGGYRFEYLNRSAENE